jgi:hypothetical protein
MKKAKEQRVSKRPASLPICQVFCPVHGFTTAQGTASSPLIEEHGLLTPSIHVRFVQLEIKMAARMEECPVRHLKPWRKSSPI